jgi:hypothetical protein
MPAPEPAVIDTVEALLRRVTGPELTCCPQCAQPAMRGVDEILSRRPDHQGRQTLVIPSR